MIKRPKITVRVGYEIGTGAPSEITLAHTFVVGQTQVSGKTTTLQAIVSRSGCRALAFVTKRGEHLDGRRIRPYLPREGDEEIHWRYVETIMASALGQKNLKFERLQIIAATRGAYSLEDVRRNITRLHAKAKGTTSDIYLLLGEYLDLVLPEMRAMKATPTLDLQPGLNVMDLVDLTPEMQSLVIGAAIQRINEHEQGVLTVFPEAWQFAPRDRNTAAKFQAEKMARMGAGIGNFLLVDSQDIIGVSQVLRDASTVWIVGVQRSDNELKRGLSVIKSSGAAAPKPAEIGTLSVGQFFVCHGRNAVKTYVQPAGMLDADAVAIARAGSIDAAGEADLHTLRKDVKDIFASPPPAAAPADEANLDDDPAEYSRIAQLHDELAADASIPFTQPPPATPAQPESEDDMSSETDKKLDTLIALMTRQQGGAAPSAPATSIAAPAAAVVDEDALYQRFKARLLKEPAVLKVLADGKAIEVTVERQTVEQDGSTLIGRIARLIARGWLDAAKTNSEIVNELGRTGGKTIASRVSEALAKLKGYGFVTDEGNGWQAVAGMKKHIKEKP